MKTIIDTATDAGKFTTLLNALKAAALTETLRGAGPYTVFAPTDEAFKHLAPGALNALLKDTKKLKAILTYHVVPGRVAAKDVKAGDIKTLEGTPLMADGKGGATVESERGVIRVSASFENFVQPSTFGPEYLTYVLWAISPDGRRFLMLKETAGVSTSAPLPTMTVVVNWIEELKSRAPAK